MSTLNAMTIDVEDFFQVTAFEHFVARESWSSFPLRVEANTFRILELLDAHCVTATFFILGWVAEKVPSLVKRINERGHEIACHGYGHELVYRIGPVRFREDVRKAKNIIEEILGKAVKGYRAPSYSITNRSLWAFDVLVEEGFSYDSSTFPIHHDIYGIPGGERFPHVVQTPAGAIREFPISTFPLRFPGGRTSIPISGGGYLRLLPAFLVRRAIRFINDVERQPAVVYFHPWEVDPDQPRINAGLRSRFRHYVNLDKTEGKIGSLLKEFRFGDVATVLGCNEGLRLGI